MAVIGLSGFAQSGKDSVGKILVKKYGYTRVSLADGVRDALLQLNPTVLYETDFSSGYDYYHTVSNIIKKDGWEIAKLCPEIRCLLQRMGTEVGRNLFGENVWIDLVRKKMHGLEKVVITDVRFENEAEFIQSFEDGFTIEVIRDGVTSVNNHISDRGLSSDLIDITINNNGNLEDLESKVADIANILNL